MILKDLINHFEIKETFPNYLLEQTFNEVFLDGEFSKNDNSYKIEVTTRQDVTHQMFLNPSAEFPVIILSKLPNGNLNGIKFGHKKDDVVYINKF